MSLYLKQIEQLVALQKVDNEILAIRKDLESAPKEVEELTKRFSSLEEQHKHLLEKLEQMREQEKRMVFEIEEDATRVKKSKSKLMLVGNTKEYHAMMREMDNLEKVNRLREEEKQALSEEIMRQTEDLEGMDESYEEVKAELEVKQTNLQERVDASNKLLAGFEKERAVICESIPAPVLSRYEFISGRLSHPVIVPVENGICSGCHIAIPPQHFVDLQKGTQIMSCTNCQRLIYWCEHFCDESLKTNVAKPMKFAEDEYQD